MNDVRGALAGGLYELKTIAARYPAVALPLERVRGRGRVIGDTTDIVIEGFPRCASSFAVAAFRLAQEPRAMTIADHTHMPAQAIDGVRRGIPTLVLIRRAEDAIVSLLIRNDDLRPRPALRGYLRFYGPLVRVRDGIVVATFDEVVSDFGSVIERVNARFRTHFHPFVHSEENLARIEHEIEVDYGSRATSGERLDRIIPWPSARREEMKRALRRRFRRETSDAARHRAEVVYATLTT
jgi:hypothetical protein